MQPLEGTLVVDFSWNLPGPFATRELLRLGARVVHVEPPDGDPLRMLAPAIEARLNTGKESVCVDLKAEPELGRALAARADVVVDGFRPGVLDRLLGPGWLPERTVLCAITGFGPEGPRAQQVGHDLNYLGYAGALADTAPAPPPVQVADLAAGSLTAVVRILAALLERERTGRGARLYVSMTHGSHSLVAHRLGGEPLPGLLTGGLACYRIYGTADGGWLTIAALEPKFFRRLCELVGLPELADLQFDTEEQEEVTNVLRERFRAHPLATWLELFDGEEVCAGPVLSLEEAAAELGDVEPLGAPVPLGEHTAAWRAELCV